MARWLFSFSVAAVWFGLMPVTVFAKTEAPSLLIPLEPTEATPSAATSDGYLFNLQPVGKGFGAALARYGVYVTAKDLSEVLGNVSGGIQRGSSFEGYTLLGVDLDLSRTVGIRGAKLHLQINDLQGQPFSGFTGSSYFNNRVFAGGGRALRLNEFSYEQNLFERRLNLRIGRISAYTQFDGSELYCTFISTLCRTPAAYTFNRGYPPYLASSWGGVAQVRIKGAFYGNIGVYEDEPTAAETNHAGFPGSDWRLSQSTGATIPVQLGYRTTLQNDRYPRAFSVGGFYNSGKTSDPLLNTAGKNRAVYGGSAKQNVSSSVVWIQAQQMVYRPHDDDRGLTLFGGGDWATSGEPNIERMIFAGAYYKGIFSDRPNDSAGFAVSLIGVNPRAASYENTLLARTSSGQVSRSEVSYQFNYGIAIAPGLIIKPYLEYISHPDQVGLVHPSGNITHALGVGTLLEVNFSKFLGLPSIPE